MHRPLLLLSLLALALPVSAQVVPGGRRREQGSVDAEFLDRVLEGVGLTRQRVTECWDQDDAEELASLYTEDAYLITLTGESVRSRDAIRDHYAEALPRLGPLELFLTDADASNNLAILVSRFRIAPTPEAPVAIHGMVLTAFFRDDRVWRIRSQVFRPAAE